MRVSQTWTCTRCGHHRSFEISYPKYGGSNAPLARLAAAGRCSRCDTRGHCVIQEQGQRFGTPAALREFEALLQRPSKALERFDEGFDAVNALARLIGGPGRR